MNLLSQQLQLHRTAWDNLLLLCTQVVLCAVVSACSAYGISRTGSLDALGFAIFASITGMGITLLMLLGPRHNPALAA
jgi:hypothetical protein